MIGSSKDTSIDRPTDRPTVYDERWCRYLYNLGTVYEEKGVFGNDNVAMSDYKKNCT